MGRNNKYKFPEFHFPWKLAAILDFMAVAILANLKIAGSSGEKLHKV